MDSFNKKITLALFTAYGLCTTLSFLNSRLYNYTLSQKAKSKQASRNSQKISLPVVPKEKEDLILSLTAGQLAQAIQSKTLTSVEIVSTYIKRAQSIGRALYLTTEECFLSALKEAEKCDEETKSGQSRGPLHGVPISVKDHYGMMGYTSSCGMAWRLDYPVRENSLLLQLLIDQGAIPFVKTNIPQAMLWYDTKNQIYGTSENPWNRERITGGSSGGEAGMISARCSPLGIGSDLGGSLRLPSALCGVYGFKPSVRRVSFRGANISAFRDFDQFSSCVDVSFGPIGRCVDDLVLVVQAWLTEKLAKIDPNVYPIPFNSAEYQSDRKLKIGYFTEIDGFPVAECIKNNIKKYANLLTDCEVVPYSFPDPKKFSNAYTELFGCNLKLYLEEVLNGEDPEYYYKLLIFGNKHPWLSKAAFWLLRKLGNHRIPDCYDKKKKRRN